MPIHDAYLRTTPFELTFPEISAAEQCFREIDEEAAARGTEATQPSEFVMLMAVGRALQQLGGPDDAAERIVERGRLLFHAYWSWKSDGRFFLLTTPVVRRMVDGGSEAEASVESEPSVPPSRRPPMAGYAQLPQHLFWTREDEHATPESVDGFSWVRRDQDLDLMVFMGMRDDRPGFSVATMDAIPLADLEGSLAATSRESGHDFESALPGSDLEGLYELRTAGEALKLLAGLFDLMARDDFRLSVVSPAEATGSPKASAHPFTRIETD